jgi:signal transduction histidine kinase
LGKVFVSGAEMSNFVSEGAQKIRQKLNGHAAAVLSAHKFTIIERWEIAARDLVPGAKTKDSLVVQDKLSNFIDSLIEALIPGSAKYDATSGNDISKDHGQHRAVTEGYSLDQMLEEYSLLRKTILWTLLEFTTLQEGEREVINDSIDKAMRDAALQFSEAQKAQIKIALQKAETSNLDLENFAAIAAHDLKSPLNSITGFLEVIFEELSPNASEDTKKMISFVLDASERMRTMVDHLLSFASLRSSLPEFTTVNLFEVASKAAANLKTYIEERKAEVSYGPLPVVRGDLVLLVQLFQNLIANGIKYNTSQEPEVRIEAEELEKSWLLHFKDNGIGIKPEDQKFIFQPYKRLHSKKEYQGSGLGLATCSRIAKIHNGKIDLTSQLGQGTTFHVELPKS